MVGLLGLLPATGFCYKPGLHTYMTEAAAKNSVLATPGLWSDWGYTGGIPKLPPIYLPSDTYDAKGRSFNVDWDYYYVMGFGADIEDTGLDVAWSRAFNHFYNPQPPGGEKLPSYFTANQQNFSSPDWALGVYEANGSTIADSSGSIQRWSYQNAGEHFYNALILPTPASRILELSRAVQSLGHVVHHIQDMAQPQHTRIDAHCDAPICMAINPDDVSVYEIWTEELLHQGVINQNTLAGYPTVALSQPRDYWHTSSFQGLADFASRNFVTTDTAFSYDACTLASNCQFVLGALGGHSSSLPLPDGNPTTTWVTEVPISQVVPNVPAGLSNGKMLFIGQRVTDKYTNQLIDVDRIATFSVFSERLTKVNRNAGFTFENVFTVNKFNLEKQYELLLPRAVGYSTGLINYFFQYRLDIQPVNQGPGQNTKWQVTNASSRPMTAELQMYYDTTQNVRTKVQGGYYGIRTIPAGGGITLDGFIRPTDTSNKYVLVASTSQNGKSIGVAAKAFTANLIAPASCGPVSTNGRGEGYNQVLSLGPTAGKFVLIFEEYASPVRLQVKRADGQTVAYTAGAYLGGYHEFTLDFDPVAWGGTTIQVIIDSPSPDPFWSLDITCPGIVVNRQPVTFTLGATDNTRACSYNLFIAGENIKTAALGTYHGTVTKELVAGRTYLYDLRNIYCEGISGQYSGYPMWYRIGAGGYNVRIKEGTTFSVPLP